jgi:PAS domain-containing protein
MSNGKSLVLIRARHLAESIRMPTFLMQADGTMIFWNEAAESMTGVALSDTGPMMPGDWGKKLNVRDRDNNPWSLEEMPGWLKLFGEKSSFGHVRFSGAEGKDYFVAMCGVPLFSQPGELEGAFVIFWEDDE